MICIVVILEKVIKNQIILESADNRERKIKNCEYLYYEPQKKIIIISNSLQK